MQMGTALRNDRASRIEAVIGTAAIVEVRTGAPPANCAAADTGTLLMQITADTDWLTAPSGGAVSLNGTLATTSADGSGTPGHYRVWNSGRTVCHLQGTASGPTVGTGEMLLDADSITAGQAANVTSLSFTEGNA